MAVDKPQIDPYLFERQFSAFTTFVEAQNGIKFVSFASHPYTEEQEGYKYEIHRTAREALRFQAWKKSDIGNGEILKATIAAIEVPNNNLVPWQARFGPKTRPHQQLYVAQGNPNETYRIEACLFKHYHESLEIDSFDELVEIFGRKYPLLAYFFFLKDRSKYLPIAPTYFDRAFIHLGAEFQTSRRCSWENYSDYLILIGELKSLLTEALEAEVTLLDAHSFAWMLAAQMKGEGKLANVKEYLGLSATERDAIVKARIGQGKFRTSLIDYWSRCAVTDCTETILLRASHIKPWAKASLTERLSLYNGLLLSPTLDACFDSGLVSFDENGKILISARLNVENAKALSIHSEMRLYKVSSEHKAYLAYHRNNIYKQN